MREMLLGLMLVGISSAPAGSQPAMKFQSVSVTLPSGDAEFPPGPDVGAVNANCLGCHSREMVLNQPPMTRDAWAKEVDKMRLTYKAPIADADVPAIVEYLASIK